MDTRRRLVDAAVDINVGSRIHSKPPSTPPTTQLESIYRNICLHFFLTHWLAVGRTNEWCDHPLYWCRICRVRIWRHFAKNPPTAMHKFTYMPQKWPNQVINWCEFCIQCICKDVFWQQQQTLIVPLAICLKFSMQLFCTIWRRPLGLDKGRKYLSDHPQPSVRPTGPTIHRSMLRRCWRWWVRLLCDLTESLLQW